MENKKQIVIHPVLFALYPLLELYINTLHNLPFSNTILSLILIPLAALALMALLKWWIKDWDRAGFLTTTTLFLLLYYGLIYRSVSLALGDFRVERHFFLFPIWTAVIIFASSRWVWRSLRNHHVVTAFLNFMAAAAILMTGARFALASLSRKPVQMDVIKAAEQRWEKEVAQSGAAPAEKPDIYYIILDGYGRADVLQSIYDLDNSEFLDFLTARGFYIAGASHSNYIQTTLSLSSALNADYLNDIGLPSGAAAPDAVGYLIGQSRIRKFLHAQGYQLVATDSGFQFSTIANADVFLKPEPKTTRQSNPYEELVLISSAGVILVDSGLVKLPAIGHEAPRERIVSSFEYLKEAPAMPGPKFVFFHIVIPHPPFLFDRDGNPVTPQVAYGSSDGSDFPGSAEQYVAGYREQMMFVNSQMKDILDTLLMQSATPPIIIIQGDHGPGAYLDWKSAANTCIQERTSILNAYYFPDGDYELLYPEITPVNSFRVVLDTYFGANLALLEDRSYYSSWERPYDFVDVTEKSQVPCEFP